MPSLNKVILIGNIVADPELKQTQNQLSFTRFRIGVSRRFKGSDGKVASDFIDIVAWRQQAEFVCKYFKKGSCIMIVGSIQSSNWTDNSGNKRYSVEVMADEVSFGESKGNSGSSNQSYQPANAAPYSNNAPAANSSNAPESYTPPAYSSAPMDNSFEEMSGDDDLPF